MEVTYINESGESITIQQKKPLYMKSVDGTGAVKHIISTFKAPDQAVVQYVLQQYFFIFQMKQ